MSEDTQELINQEGETEESVEEPHEEPVAAPKKEVQPKSAKNEPKIFTYYKIEESTITRQRPFCERCGPGYFMADHGNRFTCGHCGFTRYKQTQKTEVS